MAFSLLRFDFIALFFSSAEIESRSKFHAFFSRGYKLFEINDGGISSKTGGEALNYVSGAPKTRLNIPRSALLLSHARWIVSF